MFRTYTGCLLCLGTLLLLPLTVAADQEPAAPAATAEKAEKPPVAGPAIDQFVPPIRSVTLSRNLQRRSLPIPEGDFVADMTAESVPPWYITPPWYAVRRPNRTLYPFKHRPLYFEDAAAERCGDSCGCLQPGVSLAKFSADFLLLPCRMCQDHPNDCIAAGRDCPVEGTVQKKMQPAPSPRKQQSGTAVLRTPSAQKTVPDGPSVRPVSGETSTPLPKAAPRIDSRRLTGPVSVTSSEQHSSQATEGIPLPAVSELAEPPEFARHPASGRLKKAN
jgi:hypothetical protein